MNRTQRIMALAINKEDDNILDHLNVPKYENTKGLNASEIKILLAGCQKLFENNDDRQMISAGVKGHVQIEEISTTEKTYVTRLQVANQVKRQLFNKHSSGSDCNSEHDNLITTTVDETDVYEDSGDEYVPDPEEASDSETDVESGGSFSKEPCEMENIVNKNADKLKRNSKNEENQGHKNENNHNKEKKTQVDPETSSKDCNNIATDDASDMEIKVLHPKKKVTKRVWNKKDHCFFCETDVMKFSRHVLRHHQSEIEVQEILAFDVRDKRRKHLFNKLRNKGNFLKSVNDLNVVPVRKLVLGNIEPPTASTFLPCKYCKGFYKKEYLSRHIKKCPHNNDDKTVRTNAQAEGQSLFSSYKKNDVLRTEIFPTMRGDAISFAAKTDPLICAVARRYLKSHREKQFRQVASRKMRQLASLLIEIKKKVKVKSLLSALDPLHFDIIVECTKIISRYDPETETYGAPSLAANLGTELKDCIDVAYNMSIKKYRQETDITKNLKTLKQLIVSEWRYEVSTIANGDLQQRKWNKPSLIPLAEDLTLLKAYLLAESEKCRNALGLNPQDEKAFKTLIEISYVQVLLLNRRRVGELQRMTVITYTTNINNQSSNEFDNCISESEKVLMRSFKRVVIRGKRGRGVPVLFTEEMVKNIDLVLQVRENFVRQKNIHLFPNTKSSTSISGSKAVYKHVRLAGAKNAAALTSTKLRKHLATMSQVINLSQQDLEQLANFMGHTSEIHKTYYRLPSDVYQTAKISKLLLLNERGEASKYKGKRLDEIKLDLSPVEGNSDEDDDEDNETNCVRQGTIGQAHTSNTDNLLINDVQPSTSVGTAQKKTKRVLEPWTDNQKNITLSYFKNHLKKKIPPKKKECLQLQDENPGIFSNKSWEKIKIFVVNIYKKSK